MLILGPIASQGQVVCTITAAKAKHDSDACRAVGLVLSVQSTSCCTCMNLICFSITPFSPQKGEAVFHPAMPNACVSVLYAGCP